VRSSLLAAVAAVQHCARSNGVSILVEDAGAGLRKSVPPGDEVRCRVAMPCSAFVTRHDVMWLQERAKRMVGDAAAASASSFFVSAVLNEFVVQARFLCKWITV
jgi:hypothetical protein